jgi:hypothetical protein|nr:MAG TPA: hypothetical protein [Bacteriophage sp.]
MTTKAVTLARKNGTGADLLLPRTSADLVGYEKENSTATNVREALDEMNDNFQGEKPGIVKRVETLEEKVQPFTAPTASAAGTEGLVPAPQAVDPSQQALRVLGLNAAFNTLTAGSFDLSWERTDSTNLVLGASNCAYGTNLEDLVVAGDYYASQWTNAPADGEGVYSLREMRTYGDANSTMRVAHAFFYAISAGKLFWRGGVAARPAGQRQEWRDWFEILGGNFAPMPTLSAGVGQVYFLPYGSGTLPEGGTWVVFTMGIDIGGGQTLGSVQFLAGGTLVGNAGTGWVMAQRIA